jgi:hypothetical protein
MFNPAKKINTTHTSKYFYILAYAASVKDNRTLIHETGELVLIPTMNTLTVSYLLYTSQQVLDKSEFAATLEALKVVQPICHANSFGSELQAAAHQIKENIVYNTISSFDTFLWNVNKVSFFSG